MKKIPPSFNRLGFRSAAARSVAVCAVLVASAAESPRAGAAIFPPQGDDTTPSMGVFRIVVEMPFRSMLAPDAPLSGYPGYVSADGRLTSPLLIDRTTTIGRSDPHNRIFGAMAPVGSPSMGNVGYGDYPSVPFVFAMPAPTREIFTQIRSMALSSCMGCCSNSDPRLPMIPIAHRMVYAGPDQGVGTRSLGMVQERMMNGAPEPDFPAKSFFDVFVEVNLPAVPGTVSDAVFPAGGTILYNDVPLVITNLDVMKLPPEVVYIHGATEARPLKFRDNNLPYWTAGEVFGHLVLAGHGTEASCVAEPAVAASLTVASFLDQTLGPIGHPAPEMPVEWLFPSDVCPPTNSTYESLRPAVVNGIPVDLDSVEFAAPGLLIKGRSFRHGRLNNPIPLPPLGLSANYSDPNTLVDLEFSLDGGLNWSSASVTGAVNVRITHTTDLPPTRFFDTEMLSLDLAGNSLSGPLRLREAPSPNSPSLGKHTARPEPGGGFRISSFFDVRLELSIDDGASWIPANRPIRVALVPPCETNRPTVVSFAADCDANTITVRYSEPMDPVSTANAGNYALSGGGGVLGVALNAVRDTATLTTSDLLCEQAYTLTIRGVRDQCTNTLNPNPTIFTFLCPPCPPPVKTAKWEQPPGYQVFAANPDKHGGDRYSDFDWITLMTAGSTLIQPNWVIADDFRSDGRPILCVRWWGSYAPGFEPTAANPTNFFEDGYVLSFFSDYRPTGAFSRPDRLLGSYVAPMSAVTITRTPYMGWDSNRIYQYEVALEDTCLDHRLPNGPAQPEAFYETSNVVYWVAITAEVGHRVIPVTNTLGQTIDWQQQTTGKRATTHFWGWHTSPIQREDISVMGHVFMQNTNWIYPTNLWLPNPIFHMELDQAFCLLTSCETNPPTIVDIDFSCDTLQLKLTFSEPLDPVTATDPVNYNAPGLISSVTLSGGNVVTVTFVPIPCATFFGVCVTGIKDLCGNVLNPGLCIDFYCPCPETQKIAKWDQPPGYLVFTNAGQNPNMHGGDRPSDFDWVTLMQNPTAFLDPNWVIADDFRSDGRPIVCVRWWGSYVPPFSPGYEDGFVLSFFSDFQPTGTAFSRPEQLLGSYIAPSSAVSVRDTGFIGWDSNKIYQYEVRLEDTCLDHAVSGLALPGAFMERSNVVYWLAITAQVGHRVFPITNECGVVIDWVQTISGKRATNHFWGWHTAPSNRLDRSVMGHVLMPNSTNWSYPTNLWMPNAPFHMDIDQAFTLLTTNPPVSVRPAKWSQRPGFAVFTNSPQMRGGDRPSDFDWVTLMNNPTASVPPNWVIADDFRSDGRPIAAVRWWGSYLPGYEPGFEDGYVLSFFNDFRPATAFSRPNTNVLGTYVAPLSAVRITRTPYIGWDSNCIYQYEVNLADTCLDHAPSNSPARPRGFHEVSNTVYWVAITAEVGHRVVPVRNATGAIVDWQHLTSGKRATNHFWGWHTSPIQREDVSVMGHVLMQFGTNWVYPFGQWQPNPQFHMEIDQAFELLTCPPAPKLNIVKAGLNVIISWDGLGYQLQGTPEINYPCPMIWTDIPGDSPQVIPIDSPTGHRFFRACCP